MEKLKRIKNHRKGYENMMIFIIQQVLVLGIPNEDNQRKVNPNRVELKGECEGDLVCALPRLRTNSHNG